MTQFTKPPKPMTLFDLSEDSAVLYLWYRRDGNNSNKEMRFCGNGGSMTLNQAIYSAKRLAKQNGQSYYVVHIPDPDVDGSEFCKYSFFTSTHAELEDLHHASVSEIVYCTEDDEEDN